MINIEKLMLWILLCLSASNVQNSLAGTVTYNRQTTLSELRAIDGIATSGLPLFTNGFFIDTGSGPFLVKTKDGTQPDKPKTDPGYYYKLPRVIPSGYEGISTSTFNIGSPYPAHTAPLQETPAQVQVQVQQPHQYIQQQIVTENPQQQSFLSARSNFGAQQQPQQQHQQIQYQHQAQVQVQQQQHQQQQQQHQQHQHQQQHNPQQIQHTSTSTSYSSSYAPHSLPQHHLAQPSLRIDNIFKSDQQISAQSQNILGADPHKFTPNQVVVQTSQFEESLPSELRNPFYSNANLASALAHESLPTQGEQVVHNWDTNKIQKGKIHALLSGAGLI